MDLRTRRGIVRGLWITIAGIAFVKLGPLLLVLTADPQALAENPNSVSSFQPAAPILARWFELIGYGIGIVASGYSFTLWARWFSGPRPDED